MNLSQLIVFSLLITLFAIVSEKIKLDLAPLLLVEEFFDYCTDNKEGNDEILKCVNTRLHNSGFETFASYYDLLIFTKRNMNNGNNN